MRELRAGQDVGHGAGGVAGPPEGGRGEHLGEEGPPANTDKRSVGDLARRDLTAPTWSARAMTDRLKGLSRQEKAACLIAERVLGAVAAPWDVDGRQGVVDAMLTLPDGRQAAFEVTALAAVGALQTDALLGQDDFGWPPPGQWWWTIQVGSPRDLPRLKTAYGRIALLCEAAGVSRPEQLWLRHEDVDPDVAWLVEESTSDMLGHPDVAAVDGDKVRYTMVVPAARGGGVDHSLAGLRQALAEAFAVPPMPRHLEKLTRTEADERHLFIPVHRTALPFAVADGLWAGAALPPEPPPLPAAVTHLWLAPALGRRVLLWTPRGWQERHPYDA